MARVPFIWGEPGDKVGAVREQKQSCKTQEEIVAAGPGHVSALTACTPDSEKFRDGPEDLTGPPDHRTTRRRRHQTQQNMNAGQHTTRRLAVQAGTRFSFPALPIELPPHVQCADDAANQAIPHAAPVDPETRPYDAHTRPPLPPSSKTMSPPPPSSTSRPSPRLHNPTLSMPASSSPGPPRSPATCTPSRPPTSSTSAASTSASPSHSPATSTSKRTRPQTWTGSAR